MSRTSWGAILLQGLQQHLEVRRHGCLESDRLAAFGMPELKLRRV
jgi:hypothetical protein